MSRGKRKRYNPLEEAPAGAPAEAEHAIADIGQVVGEGPAGADVERIERLPPSQMVPDRFQPRRLLPQAIRGRFFAGAIDCYQAAHEWLGLARTDPGWRLQVEELLTMGDSFEAHGQIKPITGAWAPIDDGGFVFQIETGERRYWAACLRAVQEGAEEEPLLRVEVVERPTRQRQVLENRHALPPSAVGQACEVAALLLDAMGVAPDPAVEDEYDYFRHALSRRAPHGTWGELEPVMQLSTRRMQQLLAVLQLPSPLLELADRHQVPERVLREVLALPPAAWEEAVLKAVAEGLTSEDVVRLAETAPRGRSGDARRPPERIAFGGIRRFLRAMVTVEGGAQRRALDDVADEVVAQGLADPLLPLLKELAGLIEARRSRL